MNLLRKLLLLAWKDLQVLLKDRGFIIVIFGLPAVFAMLNGIANSRASEPGGVSLPVQLVNQDAGLYGAQIAARLRSISVLQVSEAASPEQAEAQVLEGKSLAAVLIPADFSARVNAYERSTVQVVIDPAQQKFASLVTGIVREVVAPVTVQGELAYGIREVLEDSPAFAQANPEQQQGLAAQSLGVLMTQVQQMQTNPWVRVQARDLEGASMRAPENLFTIFVPSFTVMFAFFIVGAMSSELLKEKREGSLRRLMAAPLPRWTILAGKMLAYLIIVVLQVVIIFGVGNLAFDMPLGGSLAGLALVALAMGLAATGLGMLVASLARSDRQADSAGLLLGFVLAGLGGCFMIGTLVPLYRGGGVMETISRLTPHAHALEAFQMLLNEGAGVVQVLPNVSFLLGFALLTLIIGSWRFKYA